MDQITTDIHSTTAYPLVDVAPALSKPLATESGAARTEAMMLLELSKQIDQELAHHQATLVANGVDLQSSLVDSEGFPLANKDLFAIRGARNRIAMLRNDAKAVRDRVAKLLELAMNGDPPESVARLNQPSSSAASSFTASSTLRLTPFAKVNSVAPNSPAEEAGLKVGDLILRFSSITADESDGLKALAQPGVVVEGQALQLLLERNSEQITLGLTPRSGWGGRGLLGCHILPL